MSDLYGEVEIVHDWRKDGTSMKPWTYVNGDDSFGRLAIWEDPTVYAEDIKDILERGVGFSYEDSYDEFGDEEI